MNEPPSTKKKFLIVLGAICAVLLPLMIVASLNSSVAKVKLSVYTSPQDATIVIDGKPGHTGDIALSKGKHSITVTRSHFKTVHDTIDTARLDATKSFYIVLQPTDDEGQAYLDTHPDEQTLRQEAAGNGFSARQQAALKAYPFIADLPYDTPNYTINYTIESLGKVTFTITVYPLTSDTTSADYTKQVATFKANALAYLKQQKVNPAKLDITYVEDTSVATNSSSDTTPSQTELNNRQ